MGDVEDGVSQRDLCGQRSARLARVHRLARAPPRAPPGPSAAQSASPVRRRRSRSPRAAMRRRCPDGPRARSPAPAGRRPARTGDRPPSAPRRSPRRSSRGRPRAAICEGILNVNSSAGCRRSNARTQRFSRPRATASSVSTAKLPVSSTSSSTCSASAAAMQSNPGPRFAEDAGTRTKRRRITRPRSQARRSRVTQHRFLDRRRLDGALDDPRRRCWRSPSPGPSARGP